MVIFSYTGLSQVKISQKVLGEATFLTHTVHKAQKCTVVFTVITPNIHRVPEKSIYLIVSSYKQVSKIHSIYLIVSKYKQDSKIHRRSQSGRRRKKVRPRRVKYRVIFFHWLSLGFRSCSYTHSALQYANFNRKTQTFSRKLNLSVP